jgi:N-acetylglucosaminyldiphosphoundecaprenol N-acetyl-beta-D-mannosaminyltransferase
MNFMRPMASASAGSNSVLRATRSTPARQGSVLGGMRVDAGTYETSTATIVRWAREGQARYVCAANVHMLMETRDSEKYRGVVNGADLVTSDGMPLVWLLHRRGFRAAERVYGPDLMLSVCQRAEREQVPIGLFGGTPEVLVRLMRRLKALMPELQIACSISPPFGQFSAEQNREYSQTIKDSGARIVFVGLGCPKQERWMAECSAQIPAVLLGVGAAFNFHAGQVKQSPAWMQRAGLEWAFRFAMEPRRLWRRYLWHNPRFLWAMAQEEWRRWRGWSGAQRLNELG